MFDIVDKAIAWADARNQILENMTDEGFEECRRASVDLFDAVRKLRPK